KGRAVRALPAPASVQPLSRAIVEVALAGDRRARRREERAAEKESLFRASRVPHEEISEVPWLTWSVNGAGAGGYPARNARLPGPPSRGTVVADHGYLLGHRGSPPRPARVTR